MTNFRPRIPMHLENESDGDLAIYRDESGWVPEALSDALDWGEAADISTVEIGDAAAAGTLNEVARADHIHASLSPSGNYPVQIDIGDVVQDGVSTQGARADHGHAFPAPGAGYPADIAAVESDGTASTPARADHVHAHPDLSGSVLGHAKVVRKTADTTVNNSTAFVDATGLSFAIAASEIWIVMPVLRTNSSAVADIKYQFTVPTGCTYLGGIIRLSAAAATVYSSAWTATAVAAGEGVDTNPMIAQVMFVNSTTAGTVQLQFAQNTAEVSDTKILANSVILAWRVA